MRKLLQQLLGPDGDGPATDLPSLSPLEALILQMLVRHGTMYGLQMVDESEGQLKRGTVYVTLQRMEKKGFVTSEQEPALPGAVGLPRRLYSIAAPGESALHQWERVAQAMLGNRMFT